MFINILNVTEEEQLEAVKQDVYAIEYIKDPSEKVQLEAVKQNRCVIKHIKHPPEKMQVAAVKQDGRLIKYIQHPFESVKQIANNMTLNNCGYDVIIYSKDKITIGCMTKSLDEWLKFNASEYFNKQQEASIKKHLQKLFKE